MGTHCQHEQPECVQPILEEVQGGWASTEEGGGGEARGNTTAREQTRSGEKTHAQREGRSEQWVGLGEFPRVINFPAWEHAQCLPAGLLAEAGAPGSLATDEEGGLAEGLSV